MTTLKNKRMNKEKFKNWYRKNGYSERNGFTRFCKETGCPKGTLSGWLNDEDPSPLPWCVPLIMEILELRGKL